MRAKVEALPEVRFSLLYSQMHRSVEINLKKKKKKSRGISIQIQVPNNQVMKKNRTVKRNSCELRVKMLFKKKQKNCNISWKNLQQKFCHTLDDGQDHFMFTVSVIS